jgi:hypothetical protein
MNCHVANVIETTKREISLLQEELAMLEEFLKRMQEAGNPMNGSVSPNTQPQDPRLSQIAHVEPGQFENMLTGGAVTQYLNIKGAPATIYELIDALTIGRCKRFLAGKKKATNIRKAVSNSNGKLVIRGNGREELVDLTRWDEHSLLPVEMTLPSS